MKHRFTRLLFLLVLLAFISSSCGTTVYRSKAYKSNKYIKSKTHWHWWHAHTYRPHPHPGGGWW